ncbi:plastid division2 [Rhynchospora pubera]|uniref:Plastid division2 n=1 Tax=Rhynchospora pubera TaxID=906938 RepID=A0AAV8CYT7_9POAL|nr:plastid division2 [Rhynchospora pubera]
MEGAEIGLVLAHAAELRLKISDCIRRNRGGDREGLEKRQSERYDEERDEEGEEDEREEEGDDEQEALLAICDALKSLEDQLAQLQDLQQQQRYERETILSQIDRSRRVLLTKLREYKGQDWEIINEAAAFAGETFDPDEWAPLFSPHPFSNDTYTSSLTKAIPNGITKGPVNEPAKCPDSKGNVGMWSFVGWLVKTSFTVLGVVAAARVAGYKPVLLKTGVELEVGSLQCPRDKLLVVEDGVARCVAKRRVTAPFESGVKEPNSLYGLG